MFNSVRATHPSRVSMLVILFADKDKVLRPVNLLKLPTSTIVFASARRTSSALRVATGARVVRLLCDTSRVTSVVALDTGEISLRALWCRISSDSAVICSTQLMSRIALLLKSNTVRLVAEFNAEISERPQLFNVNFVKKGSFAIPDRTSRLTAVSVIVSSVRFDKPGITCS